jgi:hypothetical protein
MLLLIASLLAAPAAAQEDPKPAAAALARALTPPQRYQGMLEQLYRPLLANAERTQGGDKVKLEKAAAQIREAAAKAMPYDDLLTWTAEVYAAHFTAAELRELGRFYQSPLGTKFNGMQPQINSELLQKVVQVFPPRFEAAMKESPAKP